MWTEDFAAWTLAGGSTAAMRSPSTAANYFKATGGGFGLFLGLEFAGRRFKGISSPSRGSLSASEKTLGKMGGGGGSKACPQKSEQVAFLQDSGGAYLQ